MLAGQFRKPRGLLGRYISGAMLERNRQAYDWLFSNSDIGPDDRVLEIGFGPGHGIKRVLDTVSNGNGFVAGLDFSSTMCKKARASIRRHPAREKAQLEFGDAAGQPFADASFDTLFAVNVVYFWKDLSAVFKELRRVLRPGGRAVLYFSDAACLKEMPIADESVFNYYDSEYIVDALRAAGFTDVSHLDDALVLQNRPWRRHLVSAIRA